MENNQSLHFDNWEYPSRYQLHIEWKYEHDKMPGYLGTDRYNSEQNFLHDVKQYGKVIRLTRAMDMNVGRRSHSNSIKSLDRLLSTYRSAEFRKGVPDRLLNAFKNQESIPMSILWKKNGRMFVVGGNTRLDVARIAHISPDPKVLVVNMPSEEQNQKYKKIR